MQEQIPTQAQPLNIYQKLAKIRKPVEVLKKNSKGYGYTYVNEELILSKITGLMEKYDVSLVPGIVPGTMSVTPYAYVTTKTDKTGQRFDVKSSDMLVQCDMVWEWINNENPDERISVPWAMVGQQTDASQAFGSGLSYSSRYFLLKYFNVSTTNDDPDYWRSEQAKARDEEDSAVATAIIDQALAIINGFLETSPDRRDDVIAVTKMFAKDKNGRASSNPRVIKSPEIASRFLQEINKLCAPEVET